VGSGEGTDDGREPVAQSDDGSSKAVAQAPVEEPVRETAVEEKPIVERSVAKSEPKPVAKSEPKPEPKPEPVKEKPVVAKVESKPAPKPQPIVEEEDEAPAPVLARAEPVREARGMEAKSMRTLDTEEKPVKRNGRKGPDSVRFGLASTRLSESARNGLDKHVAYLRAHESATVLIEGHTDEIGSEEINLVLSEARAEAAKKYLLRKGIAQSRITTTAYGETNPPYPPGSNTKNRCAFFKIDGE
jgi:outer membrane protein OmpA-like peptidoglycan-associated protein